MTKNKIYALFAVTVVAALMVACASIQIPGVSAQAQPSQSAQRGGFNADPSKMPVEQKLGIGILKLEGTPQAITPQQAKDLLPLWKAVKSLASSNNTSQEEITALYKQIEAVLTPDQVQAIQKMTWTQQELRATMQQYNIQFAQGGFGGTPSPAQETRIAQFRAQGAQGGGGGGGFGGGQGGGGFGGGNGQGAANPQRTPGANQGRRGGGFNNLFADAVIKLLSQKTGS